MGVPLLVHMVEITLLVVLTIVSGIVMFTLHRSGPPWWLAWWTSHHSYSVRQHKSDPLHGTSQHVVRTRTVSS